MGTVLFPGTRVRSWRVLFPIDDPSTELANVRLPRAMVRMDGLGICTVASRFWPDGKGFERRVRLDIEKKLRELSPVLRLTYWRYK
jgi:hypothetical protein